MSVSEGRESTSTSQSLLGGLRAHEPEAWDRLVFLYAPLVWHWCRKMGLPAQESGDVFQEVFQAVALHLDNFRRERSGDTFRGWLRTITKNKVNDLFRARRREPQGAGGTEARAWWAQVPDAKEVVDEEDDAAANGELLRRALALVKARFEERTWKAFWRVVVDGVSAPETACELGMTPGAVRVAKCRVLQHLRQEFPDL